MSRYLIVLFCFMLNNVCYANTYNWSPQSDDSSKAQMIKNWERAKKAARDYLDAMPPEGGDYRPVMEVRSFAEQMLHLAQTNINFTVMAVAKERIYAGENLEKTEKYHTKAELAEVVMNSYDYIIGAIHEMSPAGLDKPSKASAKYSVKQIFDAAFEHQSHHKGQTVIYLRLKGVKPPPEGLF